ncbi:ubiquinone biosynthesis methyltransferase COQ5 [Haematococcus lacustris]|uniref:2-methoxy-6-polyprenyl-1,4-benzoquinol methylase, mitochondrial n=1 Tax=Haematococcus lacustris TaxID=44745 RepID=A0A699ZDA8_HAELA|nr:ubiquinone biosynthesis methyltransferase COQ5 [Haematococcus lacustris]
MPSFKDVPRDQKANLVAQVFSSVASSYDVMNDLMSAGLHRVWKDQLVQSLQPFPGMRHLDVAGGTGDVAFRVLRAIRKAEALDGRDTGLVFELGNAEALDQFPDASFDAYTIAFGIRNVTDRPAALREAYRLLKPGGRFLCLEFSHVSQPVLRQAYDAYSFAVIPRIGGLVAGDAASYQYLVESIRQFPDQDSFADMIEDAGFKAVGYTNIMGGVVALHTGYKLPN